MLQAELNPLWGGHIEHFDHDLQGHEIRMHIRRGSGRSIAIRFITVLACRFDLVAYGETSDELLASWEVVELSEIHFLSELRLREHRDRALDHEPYHFLCEMFRSRLFIRCKALEINGRSYPLPPV